MSVSEMGKAVYRGPPSISQRATLFADDSAVMNYFPFPLLLFYAVSFIFIKRQNSRVVN